MTGSETSLVSACVAYLRARGMHLCWRQNTGAARYGTPGQRMRFVRFSPVGMSDIVFAFPGTGRMGLVECKRHPNVLSWGQEQFLELAKQQGVFTAVVYSVEELEQALQQEKT